MSLKISKPFWQVLGLGVLAGMRSMAAPAVASHLLSRRNSGHLAKSSLDFMQSEQTVVVLKILGVGELIADKLPFTPDRIRPLGVAARCLAGFLAGASICKASGKNSLAGALIGSAAAFGSSFGSYYLRKKATASLNLSNPIAGGLEDILVIVTGVGIVCTA